MASIIPSMIPRSVNLGSSITQNPDLYFLIVKFLENHKAPKAVFIQANKILWNYYGKLKHHIRTEFLDLKSILEIYKINLYKKDWQVERNPFYFYYIYGSLYFKNPFFYGRQVQKAFLKYKEEERIDITIRLYREKGFLDIGYVYKKMYKKDHMNFIIRRFNDYHWRTHKYKFYPSPLNAYYVKKTILLLEKMNIPLFFLEGVGSESIPTSEKAHNEYLNYYRKIGENVKFLNKADLKRSEFVDSIHLGREGAAKNTLYIRKQMEEMGLLKEN